MGRGRAALERGLSQAAALGWQGAPLDCRGVPPVRTRCELGQLAVRGGRAKGVPEFRAGMFWFAARRLPDDKCGPMSEHAPTPRYRWPYFLLAAVVLAIVLAVIWVNHEVQRTRRNRQLNDQFRSPPPTPMETNQSGGVVEP